MLLRRHWIPPGALIFAQLAHGASWILLAAVAFQSTVSVASGAGLAWVHTVALGWLTMAALGILIHVVPGFTGVRWRGERAARLTLVAFGVGVVWVGAGWFLQPRGGWDGRVAEAIPVCAYFVLGASTLRQAAAVGKTEAAIGRALMVNLSFLVAVALIGAFMAGTLVFGWYPTLFARLPAIHAEAALYGWLTMLVYGVSARTMRPICGAQSRIRRLHVVAASSVLFGPIFLAVGLGTGVEPVEWIGALILGFGAIGYSLDVLDIVRRATIPHRPPQAFIVASVVWLIVATLLGFGLLLGKPWGSAYVFVMLVGWIGQMANAHFLHIGVRLIATVIRGDDDETRPAALLDPTLSWFAFAVLQAAVALGCYGLLSGDANAIATSAAFGFVAWLASIANAVVAARRAYAP